MSDRQARLQREHDERMARIVAEIDAADAKATSTYDQLLLQLAAMRQRAEVAEARVAELEAHIAARQRRSELDETGWCAMCNEGEVQP